MEKKVFLAVFFQMTSTLHNGKKKICTMVIDTQFDRRAEEEEEEENEEY